MRKRITFCIALLIALALITPVFAVGEPVYAEAQLTAASAAPCVIDHADLLLPEEERELNAYAQQIAETYGIGVYIMTVYDFRDYGEEDEIFEVLWNYYHDNGLGYGTDREGMILMLSMAERDFATFFYGENTEYAFNSYGQEQLEGYFLDNFGENDWYGGFDDYLWGSEAFLKMAAIGEPIRQSPTFLLILFVGSACIIAAVSTFAQWLRMRNVAAKTDASEYQTPEGLRLSHAEDRFLFQNVTRRIIEMDSGSSSHSGGGGSGRSGKF